MSWVGVSSVIFGLPVAVMVKTHFLCLMKYMQRMFLKKKVSGTVIIFFVCSLACISIQKLCLSWSKYIATLNITKMTNERYLLMRWLMPHNVPSIYFIFLSIFRCLFYLFYSHVREWITKFNLPQFYLLLWHCCVPEWHFSWSIIVSAICSEYLFYC